MRPDGESLTLARAFVLRRFSVIPIPRPSAEHDGKRPTILWREFQDRVATDDELVAWFTTDQNLAIVTGRISGIVIVDVDHPAALTFVHQRLPWTPWQCRTGKGWHLYYRHPGVSVRNAARLDTGAGRLAIDIRADGGYCVAPGSIHASGVVYDFAGDWDADRACLPYFWPGWLARPRPPQPPTPPSRPTGDLVDRARRYLAAIPVPVIGAGSDAATLNAACRLVRGFALSEADAIDLLWTWAGGRPGWSRDWIEEKVANAGKYGTEPIGALQ